MDVYRCRACGYRAEWPRIEAHVSEQHPGWGGRRPGSGRPRSPSPLRSLSVRLPFEDVARLKELGDGNASLGIRRLLEVGQAASAMDAAFSEFGNEPAYIHEAAGWLHRALHPG